MPVGQLAKLPHVGAARAARVFAVVELGRRLMALPPIRGQTITTPKDIVDAYGKRLLDI